MSSSLIGVLKPGTLLPNGARLVTMPSEFKSVYGKVKRVIPEGFRPVVVVACGSFSPPTFLHLRIFEEARDALLQEKLFPVAGLISPTHDLYGKATLAPMHHRLNMAQLSAMDSDWIDVDPWECQQDKWTRTALVLKRISDDFQRMEFDIGDTKKKGDVRVMLICGSDLLETFETIKPDGCPLWLPEDLDIILKRNGIVCIQREGYDAEAIIEKQEILKQNRDNITIAYPKVINTISSTAVRQLLQENKSIKYLVPDLVEQYIRENQLNRLPNWQ